MPTVLILFSCRLYCQYTNFISLRECLVLLIAQVIIQYVIAEPNIAAHCSHRLYSNDNRNMTLVCVSLHFLTLFKAVNIYTSLALHTLFFTLTLQTAHC